MYKTSSIVPGSICWLPQSEQISQDDMDKLRKEGVDPGCLGHPIVVLSLEKNASIAVSYILTTFGGKSLHEYCTKNRQTPLNPLMFFPIHPAPRHPITGQSLNMKMDSGRGGGGLDRPTYVRTQQRWNIPTSILSPLRKACRLDEESLGQLQQVVAPISPKAQTRWAPTTRQRSQPPPSTEGLVPQTQKKSGGGQPQNQQKRRRLDQPWRRLD